MYEGTITFVTTDYKNNEKTVRQSLVVENAESFADAESQLYEYGSVLEAIDVVALRRSQIKEIINTRKSDKDLLWMAELQDIYLAEDGEEKQIKYKVLLFANKFDNAKSIMSEHVKQGYSMEIVSIKKTKFKDVLN